MRGRADHLAAAVVVAALLLAGSARAEDAPDAAAASAAEQVREAGEAARRGDALPAGEAAGHGGEDHVEAHADGDAHGTEAAAGEGHVAEGEAGHGEAGKGEEGAPHANTEAEHGETAAGEADGHGEDADAAHGKAAAHPEPAPQRGPQPYEVIRSLQFLQDQAARGNESANRVQARLLQWYGPAFQRASQETWKDPRNQRAAALFVLSGGPPSVLRMILAKNDFPPDVRPLLDGALAYVENRQKEAETMLSALDTATMEPGLAAQVNLALAQMQEKAAPDKALERLRRVMLDASGTLLEEAALRLGMALAEQLGEHARADDYARLYFARYASSIYAGNFRARFTALYVARPFDQAEETVGLVEDAVARIPLVDQVNIYLSIGRRALVAGNMKLAGLAGARVLDVRNLSQAARQRALLYVAASTLTERDTAETLASLEAIDREILHPADRKLFDAAMGVLGEIRKPLMAAAEADPNDPADTTSAAALDSSVVDRATKLLDAVRSDLEGMDK